MYEQARIEASQESSTIGLPTLIAKFSWTPVPSSSVVDLQLWFAVQVRCYNTSTGAMTGMLTGHKHAVHSLSFDVSSRMLLTASVDAALIWNIHDWTRIRTMGCGTGIVQVRGESGGFVQG